MVTVQQSTGQKIVQSGVHKTLQYWELLYLYIHEWTQTKILAAKSELKKLEILLLWEQFNELFFLKLLIYIYFRKDILIHTKVKTSTEMRLSSSKRK